MRPLLLIPFVLCACLPTGTGNPLADASAGQDGGAAPDASGFDAAASSDAGPGDDGGPSSDAGPSFDADVDSGLDASCPDAGPPACGTTGGALCECLAGEALALGEGHPLALADHAALDGRATLLRQRGDATRGEVIEALVVATDDGSTESTTLLATQVGSSAGRVNAAGDALALAYVREDASSELQVLDVDPTTGAAGVARSFAHTRAIGELALARAGATIVTAFVSASSDDASAGESVFVHRVVDGVADAEASQFDVGTTINAIAISAASATWLLAYATDTAVFTQRVDASGMAVGAPAEIASASFVTALQLVTRDAGFLLAFDGVTPAVHFLDAAGASSSSTPVVGRILALEWVRVGHAMSVRSDAVTCSSSASPLIFERVSAELMPLHEPVRVGAGDSARVALIDDVPWVSSFDGTALSLVNACVAD